MDELLILERATHKLRGDRIEVFDHTYSEKISEYGRRSRVEVVSVTVVSMISEFGQDVSFKPSWRKVLVVVESMLDRERK